jgi:preprotein translocase subunit YajC
MLDMLISPAYAQAAGAPPSMMSSLLLPLIFLAVMFFLIVRPQMKRAKEHRNMVSALAKGDEVVVAGGILGRIEEIGDAFLTVEVADGVRLKLQKHAVAAVLPRGTIKAA